ncbi:hypothetical protein PSHT_09258 [Puccinia striiformis]|uniref:CxC1-like cysteine cluster associated with KDZ transposases domain-containing protein n=1 Tax=Puccinia striiformis TaxID=27350 RepID=A0A2S4VI05_9BASI|nr:hypothetical protein PSHT_09258 [Puccinia striiformis]
MAKLFPAYMWLKGKTQNWTATNSQDSFTSKFCKCPDSAPRFHRWIDLVDITGQQRMRFTFCKCIPRPVQILANGFLPSSPDEPTTGFSMRLLAYHNHAWHYSNVRMTPFAETQQVFNEERSETLWNKGQSALVLAQLEYRPPSTPLSCQPLKHFTRWEFSTSTPEGCREKCTAVGSALYVHRSCRSGSSQRVHCRSRTNLKIRKKPDKCADSHKAGNDNRNETTWKSCDDTGIMGACCRHDAVIHLCNIHGTGENRALPLAILERIIKTIEPNRPIGVLYDLGCSLDKFIDLLCVHHANLTLQRRIWPESRSRLSFGTSVFHAYATRNNRLGALAHRCKFRNKKVLSPRGGCDQPIGASLQPKRRWTAGLHVEFFRSQWQDQVRVALDKDEDAVGQSNLAMFYENEEVLNEIRGEICVGPWPSSLMELNNILTTIKEREEAQHKLAAMLGKDYEQLRGMRTTEVGMLTLLWKAKSDLFATAVDVRAERQPLISTDSG